MGSSGEFTWIVLFFCMTAFPFLTGKGVLTVLHGKKKEKIYVADCLLTGWIAVIGLAEAAHLTAVFLGRSFSDVVLVFGIGVLCCTAAAGGVLLWKRYAGSRKLPSRSLWAGRARSRKLQEGRSGSRKAQAGRADSRKSERDGESKAYPYSTLQIVLFLVFVALIVCRMMPIVSTYNRYLIGDMTAETVESFLRTDSVYQVDPLTGSAYTAGLPLRFKILCLPTLYGALCRIFGTSAAEMVWRVIPVAVLLGSCFAYYLLACSLFPGETDDKGTNREVSRVINRESGGEVFAREKRWLFLVFVALIFLVGDYLYCMDGFGLAYSGFRGVTIRNMVLLPYMLSLILRRRWKTAVICALAEACIVWTLYGMGMCLFVLAGMAIVQMSQKPFGHSRLGKEVGE